jgi:hypothetical protein
MIRVILVCSTNGGARVDLPCHAVLHVHYYLQNPEMDIMNAAWIQSITLAVRFYSVCTL